MNETTTRKLSPQLRLKIWFNRRWPYYRLCLKPWCWRWHSYDHRCWKHYGWKWPEDRLAQVEPHTDEGEFIQFTKEQWREVAQARLSDLGLTYADLERQAKDRHFTSTAARRLWVLIGGTL